MANPVLSVVVPIYNVERYLPKCLDSLLSQTISGIEIICVDDGSPDDSARIAENYAKKHKTIRVVHKENGGLGPARNTGMRYATGDYIGFVDSDDWVDPDMYERLYRKAKITNADIVVGGHKDATDKRTLCVKQHPYAGETVRGRSQIDPIRLNLYGHAPGDKKTESFPMAVWASIYRREMLADAKLNFKHVLSEDTIFNISAYALADTIAFTDITGYCYRKEGQASITKNMSFDLIGKHEQFIDELKKLAINERVAERVDMRIARTALDCIRLCAGTIAGSEMSMKEKGRWLSKLANSELAVSYAAGFPICDLPVQQRVFQRLLVDGHYWSCIILLIFREWLKRFRR